MQKEINATSILEEENISIFDLLPTEEFDEIEEEEVTDEK